MPLVAVVILFGHLQRSVRTIECQVGEERLGPLPGNELDRGVRENVAAIAVGFYLAAVERQRGIEIAVTRRIGRLADTSAAVHQGLFKSLINRARGKVVAQMPLAKNTGPISGFDNNSASVVSSMPSSRGPGTCRLRRLR